MKKKSKEAEDIGVNGPPPGNIKGGKIHHAPDYAKNKDADVIPKGNKRAIPNEYWQRDVSESVFVRGYGDDPKGAFLSRPGKDRAQPHVKINECDH
jgi:hypothetical protein